MRGQGGGWFGAHGSQVIDQIRFTLGEFTSVSALLPNVGERPMSAEDGFLVHFRLAGGCVGTLQSTCADRSPPMIETRVAGTRGSAWIRGLGSDVFVADAAGTRKQTVDDDLIGGEIEPPPAGALETDYERMIGTRPRHPAVHPTRGDVPRAHRGRAGADPIRSSALLRRRGHTRGARGGRAVRLETAAGSTSERR